MDKNHTTTQRDTTCTTNYYSDVTTYRFYNKRHQLVQRASIVVICFTLFRNVRPCTILGYTLTNIPQKFNADKHNKKRTSTKLRAVIEEGPCIPLPSYPIPSMVTTIANPIAFSPNGPQSISSFGPYRRHGRSSRGTYSGRGRAPRGRRGKTTSTTSCQTSPIPSYFWPDYQPGLVSSRGSSANEALNLALMPRVFDHFPASLPLNPLHYDFFTVLRAASPVVTFHCPSPLTQKSFSSVYSISFPHGHDTKSLLVAGIKQ